MSENQTTAVRRPVSLWVLVGLYSTFMLGSVGFTMYLRFWSSYSSQFEAGYADWTLVDYVVDYYPAILVLIGCAGLVMLKRWAIFVFGMLLALRSYELVVFLMNGIPDVPAYLLWPTKVLTIGTAAIAFGYAVHLWRKGILRKGV